MNEQSKEMVNHPGHYNSGGIEVIDIIEAYGLGFSLGNAVKYILRAGRKPTADATEDLRKAAWYIGREIARRDDGRTLHGELRATHRKGSLEMKQSKQENR